MSETPEPTRFSVSIRFKIMLLIIAIVVVIQGTVSVIVLLYQREAVRASFDSDLEQRLDYVVSELEGSPGTWSRERLEAIARRQAGYLYFENVQIAVYDADNAMTFASLGDLDDIVIEAFQELASNATRSVSMMSRSVASQKNGKRMSLRLACKSFSTSDGDRYAVCFVTSDEHSQRTIRKVGAILLLAAPVSVFAVGVASWFVGGMAVRPLADVHHFASSVRDGTLPRTFDTHDQSSEMIEIKRELEDAMRSVRNGYARQSRFLSNISHELKTPISVIKSEAEALLASHEVDENVRDFIRSTSEEMSRLGRLVESFLLLSRVQEGNLAIRPKAHHANDVLMEAIEFSAPFARQMGVSLRPTLAESPEDLRILCNAELLATAIANVIRNAVRFSPKGEPVEIDVALDGEDIRFTVRDYGPGIPDELMGTLFEPYTQSADEAIRNRGTGLGLQIALGIAEIHGGSVRVKNLEQGCAFTIKAPRFSDVPSSGSGDTDAA